MDTKANLRDHFRSLRKDFHKNGDLETIHWSIARKIHSLIDATDLIWASYVQYGSEANTEYIQNLAAHIKWAFPVLEDSHMKFYIPNKIGEWHLNKFKIKEPIKEKSKEIPYNKIQGILVPGLAFDRKGNRLGSGLGFYDKYLNNFKNKKIGIAYDIQISEQSIPTESFDVLMDYVVTEKQIIKIERMAS